MIRFLSDAVFDCVKGSIDLLESFGVVNENETNDSSASQGQPLLTYDYVLVAKSCDENSQFLRKRNAFIQALKSKELKIEKFTDGDEKVFFCIRAPDSIFETYRYLLKVSDACNWDCEQQGVVRQSTRDGSQVLTSAGLDWMAEQAVALKRDFRQMKLGLRRRRRWRRRWLHFSSFLLQTEGFCWIRIVDFILHHTCVQSEGEDEFTLSLTNGGTRDSEYLPELMKNNVFETHFCLHEKSDQKQLKQSWARWSACFRGQPITKIRNYLGEKVALYFLWLGWYTFLLIPAALIGLVVFLYGLAFYSTSPLIKEVCESEIIMCPLCNNKCKVWKLSDTCAYAKMSLLFDNEGTVAFAMFMAVWATVFLEFWKRHRSSYVCEWRVFDWCEEELNLTSPFSPLSLFLHSPSFPPPLYLFSPHLFLSISLSSHPSSLRSSFHPLSCLLLSEELILEIVNDPKCVPVKHQRFYLSSIIIMLVITLMLLLIIGLTHALVVFRVIATVALAENSNWLVISDNSQVVALMLGSVLHYVTITVMTRVNCMVATKLSEIDTQRSRAAVERSFTINMFIFQFFTMFSSLIYTAFFLGRINGHPGGYVKIAGLWRLEECHPSGCLTDLFIQMSIIMVLKQTFNNIFEYSGPWFSRWLNRKKTQRLMRRCLKCYKKECLEATRGSELCENCKLEDLRRNYSLIKTDRFSIFNEYLEMVIQFSFTTIFVAAFPLAPLLALLNNIIEIRLDAIKMVSLERRMVPTKANDIGVWTDILEAVGVLAVIANGLVIGISSDFIPRLVYQYYYGPCTSSSGGAGVGCMVGYINNTLSVANMSDERVSEDFKAEQRITDTGLNVTHCRYRDYRSSEDFGLTNQFWVILAARLIFILLFQHVVVMFKCVTSWFVATPPLDVRNERLNNKLKRLKKERDSMTKTNDNATTNNVSEKPQEVK
ncbi:hypothetical protein DNTS_011900 [Danionella cerebrum]|uniref:Anoctamin n=1 Tax=Danionella cerebrum TaxID=2873325 RepID=A0A553Q7G9_9TELE|nr:hypothetical protein DNTS_011900 [Danionella translucida]